MDQHPSSRGGFLKSIGAAFFGDIARDQVSWWRAAFADHTLEDHYQRYLVDIELPKERLVNYFGILTYISFGVLDLMTFSDRLSEVLWLRWGICSPLAILLITSTYLKPMKPYFQWVTALVMLIGGLSMVRMIAILPEEGGPPYIMGILTIFIFYSCIQRMHFQIAAAVFLITTVTYSLTIIYFSSKTSVEIASGHFFAISITVVALATSYTQEVRSRLVFYRNRQRELDAAFIEKLLIEATASDQSKINFLSILSHELRTPLHQIIGFSEVVKTQMQNVSDSDGNMPSFLDQIHTSASGLLSMIGKMLRYADATAGKIKYDPDQCDLRYLVETVVDQAFEKAAEAEVMIDSSAIEPATLNLDHIHTANALGHILDNAIAASTKGGRIVFSGKSSDSGDYLLKIEDFGSGMTPDQIETAFKPFSQTENARTRSIDGIGLGLTLSQKILSDQGAQLKLDSTLGEGTTVEIRFPANAPEAAEPKLVSM